MDRATIRKTPDGGFIITSSQTAGEPLAAYSTFAEVVTFLRGVFEPTPPNTLADETLLSDLPLSCRTANCLINNENIKTVGQLQRMSEAEILRMPGFGRKSLKELKGMGFEFGKI